MRIILHSKPALFVLRSREPSAVEVADFINRSEMSSHEMLAFLSFSIEEQTRRYTDWQAATLDRELSAMGETVAEVVSEDGYRALPWRCRWGRDVEWFD